MPYGELSCSPSKRRRGEISISFVRSDMFIPQHDLQVSVENKFDSAIVEEEFSDLLIPCLDCDDSFTWTAGEQAFYRDKQLQNPPKRCKECKKAKNHRIEAIELSRLTGKRHKIEVKAECAQCATVTTVPFYPSQGRPVFCRACFLTVSVNGTNGNGTTIH